MAIDRETLTKQHAAIEESAGHLSRAIGTDVPDLEQLARAKWQLGYRLAIHLAHEDTHIYPVLKTHPDPTIAKLAALYESEMGDLDERLRDYIASWPTVRILSEWPAFQNETQLILELLAQRIGREEHELYPLLAAND